MDYFKRNHLSILIILFLVGSSLFNAMGGALGALDATNITNPFRFANTVRIGTNGSEMSELKGTTCNLIGTDASQTASTTLAYDCAITGVAAGDVVLAQLGTSTPRGAVANWAIVGSKASTTAGYVTVLLWNNGAAAVPSATNIGSSTQVWYMDN